MESSQSSTVQEESKTASVAEKLPYVTYRDYFDDSYKYESEAKVLDFWRTEGSSTEFTVILDRTIFHPQGGGQPADEGTIRTDNLNFNVTGLKPKDEAILHIGTFDKEGENFEKGQDVKLKVDGEKRKVYAKYHSAGHLLDIAVRRCGQTQLHPGKGYHFPVGAYVEYVGVVDNAIKDKLPAMITEAANAIIKEKLAQQEDAVWSKILPYEEAGKVLQGGVPSYIPQGQDLRVVKLTAEDEGCPCGGTHVKNVIEINAIEVTKIIKKGKNTRISYIVKDQ